MRSSRFRRALLAAGLVAAGILGASAHPSIAVPTASRSSVAVIGDFGNLSAAQADVADLVARIDPLAVVTTGDNLYGSATYAQAVGAFYCPFLAGAPSSTECPRERMATRNGFFPSTGNHDYTDGGIAAYRAYFTALGGRTTYAVTRGGIEFLVLDSQAAIDSVASMTRQRSWVRARARASRAAWQVVVLHHAPYSSSSVHGSTVAFQWPFRSWGVDLVLSGHDHDYERLSRGGLTYVVNGSGGADLYPFARPLRGSLMRNDTDHGVLLLTAGERSLAGEFRSTGGSRVDGFTLRR